MLRDILRRATLQFTDEEILAHLVNFQTCDNVAVTPRGYVGQAFFNQCKLEDAGPPPSVGISMSRVTVECPYTSRDEMVNELRRLIAAIPTSKLSMKQEMNRLFDEYTLGSEHYKGILVAGQGKLFRPIIALEAINTAYGDKRWGFLTNKGWQDQYRRL